MIDFNPAEIINDEKNKKENLEKMRIYLLITIKNIIIKIIIIIIITNTIKIWV